MKAITNSEYDSHFNLCKKLIFALEPFLFNQTVKKNKILLTEGYECRNIYFVLEGAVKQYYLSDGKEFIQNFYFDGNMASHFNSFLTQTPSDSFLEAIEGTELKVLSYHNFQKLCIASPQFSRHLSVCVSKMNLHRVNLLLLSDYYLIV